MEREGKGPVQHLLAVSIIALAAALAYFTYELSQIRHDLPALLAAIEQTGERVDPIVGEIAEIRALIPSIIDEVKQTREQVTPILAEVAEVRALVPPLLREIEATRGAIPPILLESAAIRADLPRVLKSVDGASKAVSATAREIKQVRPLVPEILSEVEKTRATVDPTLDRVERIIATAGKEAGKGAVSGFFTGLITAPFVLVGDASRRLFGFSEEEAKLLSSQDRGRLEKSVNELLTGEVGESRSWESDQTGHTITVRLEAIEGESCRLFHSQLKTNSDRVVEKRVRVCRDEEGEWEQHVVSP